MNLLTLPGDGLGPEIVRQATKIIKALSPDMIIDSANEEAALLGKNIVESQSAEIERMRQLLSR